MRTLTERDEYLLLNEDAGEIARERWNRLVGAIASVALQKKAKTRWSFDSLCFLVGSRLELVEALDDDSVIDGFINLIKPQDGTPGMPVHLAAEHVMTHIAPYFPKENFR